MAYCDKCGNFDKSYLEGGGFNDEWKNARKEFDEDYQPDLYYYWDGDFCTEDYNWRDSFPLVDCCLLYTSDAADE